MKQILRLIFLAILFSLISSYNAEATIWSWFSNIVESVTSIWQPVWGKYSEGG